MGKKKKILGLTLLLFLLLSTPLSVSLTGHRHYPLNPNDAEIQNALDYLHTLQNNDGGFSNPGEESAVSNPQWAIMAMVAAGECPHEWRKDGHSPIDYLRENANNLMGSTDYERMILALIAVGENPRDFAGINFVKELKEKYLKEDGRFSDFIYTTIWGILALSSAGEDVSKSVEWLRNQQNEDGGFAWVTGEKSDYDDTAAAIQALIAAGESPDSKVIRDALEYLKTGQNKESNPGYLTVCAIMALLGKPFPITPTADASALRRPSTSNSTEVAGFGFLSGIVGLLAVASALAILCKGKKP